MNRTFIILLASLPALPGSVRAERADALGVDGIYEGRIGMQLDTSRGKMEYQAPAKLVFLPDGRAAFLTAQHPEGVLSVVMRGALKGKVFLAESEAKRDFGGYHYGMSWDITFNQKAGTVELHGKAKSLPKWAHDDDLRFVFHKKKTRR